MLLHHRMIEVADGVRLPCVEYGDPSGLPVLLLHGYSDSCRSFELLLPHLPRGLRAIAPSQRGHGDATRPEEGYSPEGFAADAAALLDALGIERAIVAGHSMGGQVSLRLAMDRPARVLGLVLIGGFPTLRGNPVAGALWDDVVSTLRDAVDGGFVDEFQRSTVVRPIPDAFLRTVVEESLKLPARVWRAALRGQMDADLTHGLEQISAPTLLLWGDQDSIVPGVVQQALAARIPSAKPAVLRGTGHAPHWEEPVRVAAEIAAFVATLTRG